MRIYVNNTAKDLVVTLADSDTDVDASEVPVTLTGFEDGFDGPVRFGPIIVTDKAYVPSSGDILGHTVLTMPWQPADVADPGRLRIEVNVQWPKLQTVRPLRWVKIRS